MRKIFCDGCNGELTEASLRGFLHHPKTVFFSVRDYNGVDFEWCKECSLVALAAIAKERHAG